MKLTNPDPVNPIGSSARSGDRVNRPQSRKHFLWLLAGFVMAVVLFGWPGTVAHASYSQPSSTLPVLARVTLQPGQTLSHLALRFYGDARLWVPIARANGITNTRAIPAYLRLVIPGLAKRPSLGPEVHQARPPHGLATHLSLQARPAVRNRITVNHNKSLELALQNASRATAAPPPHQRPFPVPSPSPTWDVFQLLPSPPARRLNGRRNPFRPPRPLVAAAPAAKPSPRPPAAVAAVPTLPPLPPGMALPAPPPFPVETPPPPQAPQTPIPTGPTLQVRFSGVILTAAEPPSAILEIRRGEESDYVSVTLGESVLQHYQLVKVNQQRIELLHRQNKVRLTLPLDQPISLQP